MIYSSGWIHRGETYLILIMSNDRKWKFEIKKPRWLWEYQAELDNRDY